MINKPIPLTDYEIVHSLMRDALPSTHICDHKPVVIKENTDGFFFTNEFKSQMSEEEFGLIVTEYAIYRRTRPLPKKKI